MDWKKIIALRAWTPLKEVSGSYMHLSEELYQISDELFLQAQPYDEHFVEGSLDAPFVTIIYWARSVEAIKRCVLQDISLSKFPDLDPPADLLLGTNGTYGELVALASDKASERAVYRTVDGSFVHKVVSINEFCFCFMNTKIDDSQKPYAIEITLKDR